MFLTVAEFGAKGQAELKKLGSKAYIQKPIDNEKFVATVKKFA